ncbi:MAG TPA: zinc ribbon domain-containing protein [Vicinamibacterales bacterium]|nr:zinc ribbon domain-containing protein [Vicinamibacterales bacterium]
MPVYEFYCRDCQKPFELVQSMSEHSSAETKCPGCGGKNVERRWTSVYAVTSKKS